jgi:dephospho-CoA kinase
MGKSTVLGMFRDMGAVTLDADRIVDSLLNDASVLRKVREAFGDGVFSKDARIDRSALAAVIFSDKERRDSLEGILHPLVFEEIESFLGSMGEEGSSERIVIVEIPLLFEKGYTDRFRRIITVYADEEIALGRLEELGISREEARSRLEAQMPIREKIRLADFAIDNSGPPERTREQVANIYDRLLKDMRGQRNEHGSGGFLRDRW